MHLRLLAVGDRQPQWVDDAVGIYTQRLPREWKFALTVIPTVRRNKNESGERAKGQEGEQILAKLRDDEHVILMDERGKAFDTKGVARKLTDWQREARDVCFVIGGPDGVPEPCRTRASLTWSLSPLTLPHGLARVLLVEQLYRAWSLQTGHPYHRE